jgi:hypothetical protein
MRGELTLHDRSAQVVLHLTRAELLLLAGSVNEAIDAVEDWEFPIRVGAQKAAVRTLRSELASLIARLPAELPGRVGLGQMLG